MVKNEITILLLGESGVGKSTFINSIGNYLAYETMDEAKGQPKWLIPCKVDIRDPDTDQTHTFTLGQNSEHENTDNTTLSGTKQPRSYKLYNSQSVIKIIDTPGIGDTAGMEMDDKNLENLLDFISNYREIDAICLLLKPDSPRRNVLIDYCFNRLLSQLSRSASKNILFLFTKCRGTQYAPGESAPAIKAVLDEFKQGPTNIDIPFNRDRTYCFDNESLHYLMATNPPNNMQFNETFMRNYDKSWRKSSAELTRLLKFISNMDPYNVHDTTSINSVRNHIKNLIQPLIDIIKTMTKHIHECETHKQRIKALEDDIIGLQGRLEKSTVEMITTKLEHPVPICDGSIGCGCTTPSYEKYVTVVEKDSGLP
ncbi:unnamed protein product [Oppiella nova]|uniref:G domain-containing protein n=1 Tax=Oppiella nova TaxID=334625 RepID=A0A7R9M577_9ACAR|nr:unnamed protein product [Oppiella nova]CAG2171010.1 unnamed protein product [Oppiella nova]